MNPTNPNTTTVAHSPKIRKVSFAYFAFDYPRRAKRVEGFIYRFISHRKPLRTQKICTVYAGMIQIRNRVAGEQPPQLQETKRGKVKGFSRHSRKRMIAKTMQLRGFHNAAFITLTYPKVYPLDWHVWKRHLDMFMKRLARAFPGAFGIWRLELQRRGAPHYHILVCNMRGRNQAIKDWLTKAWAEIAHVEDHHNGLYATNFKRLAGRNQALYYVCKYASKSDDSARAMGRVWGHFGNADFTPYRVFGWSQWHNKQMKAAAERLLRARDADYADNFATIPEKFGWSYFGIGQFRDLDNKTLSIDDLKALVTLWGSDDIDENA